MLILDTNVISALMRPKPDRQVVSWLDRQTDELLRTTAITVFEIRFGLMRLPAGRRRRALESAFTAVLAEELGGGGLEFDDRAAEATALLAAERQAAGTPVDFRDTAIAGVAIAYRATLVTRNLKHFAGLPVPVISPWNEVLASPG